MLHSDLCIYLLGTKADRQTDSSNMQSKNQNKKTGVSGYNNTN